MNEYYGAPTTANDDFLAHYGVKGMKWGVRKAIERGSYRQLNRQYRKASKKLAKLMNKANRGHQENLIKQATKNQKVSAGLGAVNLGVAGGLTAASIAGAKRQAAKYGLGVGHAFLPIGAGIAAADIAGNAIHKRIIKKRLTNEGHRKAVREANEFQREMNKAFKGTQYGKNTSGLANQIAKRKQQQTSHYIGEGIYSAPGRANKNTARHRSKIVNPPKTSNLSRKDQKTVNDAMKRWADTFEKQYQAGLSKGMTHEQAERYSNDYIAKNGFGSAQKKKRR